MKVKVTVPRESVKRHKYDKWKNKETPGTATFSFKGDGIDYTDIPFGPELVKLIKQVIPAEAAAKGEDVEWDINVPKTFGKASIETFDKDTGMVKSWGKDKEGKAVPEKMATKRVWNIKTEKQLKGLKEALEDAFASGDFTPVFDIDPVSRGMLSESTGHKYTHEKHPYYDTNQWEDLDTQPALGTWDELMTYAPEEYSFETQMNRARKDVGTTNAKSWASIIKNYQKHGQEALDEEAKAMQEEQDRERAERERASDAEREANIPGKKGNVNNQWKGFLKWAAKQLGGDWHDYKDTIPLELFDKVYQYDEDTGKGWYDRDELMRLLKAKQSGETLSDERMKNIVSGLTEPFQMG